MYPLVEIMNGMTKWNCKTKQQAKMKTKKLYAGLSLTFLILTGTACTQEEFNETPHVNNKRIFHFETDIRTDTRTIFDEEGQLKWIEGDLLGFYSDAGDINIAAPYINGQPFQAELSANAKEVYVYYPFNAHEGNSYLNELTSFELPIRIFQTQEQAGILNGENIPMWAKATLAEQGTTELIFEPQASVFAFNIYGASESVTSVTFKSAYEYASGDWHMNLTNGQYAEIDSYSSAMVGLRIPYQTGSKEKGQNNRIYLAVAPRDYTYGGSFIVSTTEHVYTFQVGAIDMSDVYKVQPVTLNLANGTRTELKDYTNHFQDANFKRYLLSIVDANQDDRISSVEAETIERVEAIGLSIKTLAGIEYLSNMGYLDCAANQLQDIDVSQNTALYGLSCYNNQLIQLDVTNNTYLTNLHCHNNRLTEIDLSNNQQLRYLICYGNQLTQIDISQCYQEMGWVQCNPQNITGSFTLFRRDGQEIQDLQLPENSETIIK